MGCGTGTLTLLIKQTQPNAEVYGLSARQDFSRKLKWGPSDFSGEKIFLAVIAFGGPRSSLYLDSAP